MDLLVELQTIMSEIQGKTMQLTARLQQRIGDQPINVLVLNPSIPTQ